MGANIEKRVSDLNAEKEKVKADIKVQTTKLSTLYAEADAELKPLHVEVVKLKAAKKGLGEASLSHQDFDTMERSFDAKIQKAEAELEKRRVWWTTKTSPFQSAVEASRKKLEDIDAKLLMWDEIGSVLG